MKMYLPLGSVVILKGSSKKVVIYGRKQVVVRPDLVVQLNGTQEWDYIGCRYPEGSIDGDFYLFQNEDIQTLVFRGFSDRDEALHQKILSPPQKSRCTGSTIGCVKAIYPEVNGVPSAILAEYIVNGITHIAFEYIATANKQKKNGFFGRKRENVSALKNICVGSQVSISYNPNNPDEAFLTDNI